MVTVQQTRLPNSHLPIWLLLVFVLSALSVPAAAADEPYALSHVSAHQQTHLRNPIGPFFALFLLIGHNVYALSSGLIGPLMGITSVLWLMMRNDAAVSPKASWM